MVYVPHDGEPRSAFDGGPDGLEWVNRVFEVAPRWLRRGGHLLMEVPKSSEALEPPGFRTRVTADRVLSAELL
jgi:release factor glutamine methyltransferase